MSPASRRFYLVLLYASLFSLLIYLFPVNPSHSLTKLQTSFSLPKWKSKEKFAYATFLGPPTSEDLPDIATTSPSSPHFLHDPYFESVRLLAYQIKHAEKTRTKMKNVPFLVLALPEVPENQIKTLEAEGAAVIRMEPLDLPEAFDKDFIINSRFRDVLSKLRLWQLVEYDKILYLDADSFLLANLDEIFRDTKLSGLMRTHPSNRTVADEDSSAVEPPETYLMAASSDTYGDQTEWEEPGHINYLCACFMLFAPSQALFEYYISVLNGPDTPQNAAYPEQDLLIYVHRQEGRMPWRRIPVGWSANDGEMNDELTLLGGVKSLHVKGWRGAEGGNVANEKYRVIWRELVAEMEQFYGRYFWFSG